MSPMVKAEQAPTVIPSTANEPDLEKKGKAFQSLTDIRRASAWPLHRWPIEKNVTWDRAKLHLPRSYLAKDGEDIRVVKPASDLNQIVHQHYLEQIDPATDDWVNFVTADDVVARRHEFLGPDPRVAGYHVDGDGDLHIRWWDDFLKDQWMDKQKWQLEVTWDGDKWIEKSD